MSDPKIIDSNELVKVFNYSSLITKEHNQEACDLIDHIIFTEDNWFRNSPKYQTKENIFSRPEQVWLKYRLTFLFSVFMYLGREVRVSNMMAWSYMTNTETAGNRDRLWHDHWHPKTPGNDMISGIFYLHIPADVIDINTCGTEIAPNGPLEEHSESRYFIRPTPFSWHIYPSRTWHRPGISQSKNYRFIIAADIEYTL